MDDQVSQKGTKTKARQATHSARLAGGGEKCPACQCSHVLIARDGVGRWCGTCNHRWEPVQEAAK